MASGADGAPKRYVEEVDDSEEEGESNMVAFICPLTLDTFKEPVITPYGHTFERQAIEDWISREANCPVTRQPLERSQLIVNRGILTAIEEQRHRQVRRLRRIRRVARVEFST
jgi:hypothetical protein